MNDWPSIRYGLPSNKWLELRAAEPRDETESDYFFVHESRCGGHIVAVLPYRRRTGHGGETELEFGMRHEVTPAWGERHQYSALTGGCEPDEPPRETAARELYEEAGFELDPEYLRFLGRCRGTKSSDTIYHLYAADVTGMQYSPPQGDGTKHDSEGYTTFVPLQTCFTLGVDPIFFTMLAVLSSSARLDRLTLPLGPDTEEQAHHD